jgi:hypothetical protein
MPDKPSHRCLACKQSIPAGATICSVCKSYQAPWKNWLQYFSGIAALLALTASAVAWLFANGRAMVWPRDEIGIISASSLESVAVINRGDRDVFLSNLIMTMPGRSVWVAPTLEFNEKLSPGQFLQKSFPKPKLDAALIVRDVNEKEFEAMIEKALNNDPCYELVFFEKSDYRLDRLRQMSQTKVLNTFNVGGFLQYWTVTSKSPSYLPIEGSGVVFQCRAAPN